jgi:hypothetical protein
MKLDIVKSHVDVIPETPQETICLETLWRLLCECNGLGKKLVPIGEYVPQKNNVASFHIEGMNQEEENTFVEVRAAEDLMAYCKLCNKLLSVKKGEVIPMCCGKRMEIMD